MKPAFALDFRNDAIALLHRTTGGWHQVGRVTFDEPDLASALGYLRSTALGLSPRGLATKLVLPDEQILYTTVDAPGPDDASRAAQIRSALEGRTPYPVKELIFDWEVVGGEVRVAVIARETLAEAEAFATEHRFNPVAFVAAPAAGFGAEPWFGQTAHAASLLSEGEAVERDAEAVQLLSRSGLEAADRPEAEVAAPVAEAAAAADEVAAPEADVDLTPESEPEPEPVASAVDEVTAEAAPVFAPEELTDEPTGLQDDDLPDLPPSPREQPLFGLADDEPPPSQAFRSAAAKPKETRPKERRGQDFWGTPQATRPEVSAFSAPDRGSVAAPVSPPVTRAAPAAAEELHEPAVPDWRNEASSFESPAPDLAEAEAPMALDVEDDEAGAEPALRPVGVTDPAIVDPAPAAAEAFDDVPPVPGYSPAMGFASRRASADGGAAPKLAAPPPRPTVPRPAAARPMAPVAPKAERPLVDRPTAVNPTAARESKGLRGLGALVTAPGLPGSRKKKVEIQPDPAAMTDAANAPAGKRATSLEKGIGAGRTPTRGKPRYLGLALTVILLLVLAVIAAWSTSLAFRDGGTGDTALASALPAPEDEMMADGELPEGVPTETAATETAATEAAATETAGPEAAETAPLAATDSADTGLAAPDEPASGLANDIVLAAKDPSPEIPDPLAQPEATAQGDPLPTAQAPPPPFGTVYQFDANGLIVPTPEGIVTPEGVLLIAGKPPRVPPARPEGLAPAVPEIDPAAAVLPATDGAAVQTLADPALAGFRPKARPEGLAAPVDLNAAPPTTSDNRLAGKRPLARPEAVLAAGAAAATAKAAAAASLAAPQAPEADAQTSPFAVAISRRPEARPRDLSRAVEAAVAAAVRTPEPTPEPEPAPEQTASLVPKKAPEKSVLKAPEPKPEPEPEAEPTEKASKKSLARGRDADTEHEADDEPEVASAAPSGKTSGSVAKQATFKNALALDKTALIGVYGTPSKRYAMIRTSNGRYKKVKVGDSVEGGKIQAITASEVRYQKGSRLLTLSLPKG